MGAENMSTQKIYKRLVIASTFIIPVLTLVVVLIYKTNPEYYMDMTEEDQFVEWTTYFALFISGVMSLVIAGRRLQKRLPFFMFFLLFGVASVLFAFEEISWGQRVIGIESPEYFIEHSDQKEVNVHNVLQQRFEIKTKFIASQVLFFFGAVFPVLFYDPRFRRLFQKVRLVVPSIALAPGFLIAAWAMRDWVTGREEEIGEVFFSLLFVMFMLLEFVRLLIVEKQGIDELK